MSVEEQKKLKQYMLIDFSFLLDVGTGVPPGWMPVIGSLGWPVAGNYNITSGFGPRIDPVEGIDGYHYGIDIAGPTGTPILAVKKGLIIKAGMSGSFGNLVIVDIGDGIQIYYAHLSNIAVKPGQEVEAGHIIGGMGSTGKSTGSHLHFEIRKNGRQVNPILFYK